LERVKTQNVIVKSSREGIQIKKSDYVTIFETVFGL